MTHATITAVAFALLLGSCAPPSARNMPPIIGAARSGDTVRLEQLLDAGADPDVRAGVNHWTPLLHAVHKNQADSMRVLIAHHADVNARGDGGVTPLIMAAGYGYTPLVRILLEAGADTRLKAFDGADALLAAVSGVPDIDRFTVGQCQTATVQTLLESDRDLRLTPGAWTRTAALVAKFSGCEDVIRILAARQEGKE